MNRNNHRLLVFLVLLTGCQASVKESFYTEGEHIRRELIAAHCKMEALQEQSAQLWDLLVSELSASLPANMPADERRNMLQVRNAELIRMFQVFPRLPESVRLAVERAEQKDQALAAQMKEEMRRIDGYEAKAFAFLQEVEFHSADSAAVWQERFSTLPCRNTEKTEGSKVAN